MRSKRWSDLMEFGCEKLCIKSRATVIFEDTCGNVINLAQSDA